MPVRFSSAPPPQIEGNDPLRVYLDQQFRNVANSQEEEILEGFSILLDVADNVVANTVIETPILNFANSASTAVIAVDPVLGTITLPGQAGFVLINSWVLVNQVTANRDFTVQLVVEINGTWSIIGTGYIPQQGADVSVAMSASVIRVVAADTVFRWGLLLDNQASAEFQIINSSFEIEYLTARG